jgi:acyl transferase domain-containing protein
MSCDRLIKIILAVQKPHIPGTYGVSTLNNSIDFKDLNVTVSSDATSWPSGHSKKVAGISSFGFGGTNAHVVVSEAPRSESPFVEGLRTKRR